MKPVEDGKHALRASTLLRVLPTAAVVGFAGTLAWDRLGSIDAPDWLPYALVSALVLAALLLSGAAGRPERLPLLSAGLLVGFAAWTAISIDWTPLPSLARDDALLTLSYATAFLTPLLTLRSSSERLAATVVVVGGLSALAVATAFEVRFTGRPGDLYLAGRLDFPVSYWNGEAAIALIGFWPAIGLVARRSLPLLARALALGGATAMIACWLLTQSKGGGVALAVSGIVFFAVCPARLRALPPTLIAAALGGAGVAPFTAPYNREGAELVASIRHAGTVALVLAAAGVGAGLVYALLDRHVRFSQATHRAIGRGVLAVLVAAILAGIATFFAEVDRPGRFFEKKWESFTHSSQNVTAGSHFTALGSNRYDFWRVALREFEHHPAAGIGGRGWAAAYLQKGRSSETPERAHSIELDALSETGVVGFLLLAGAGVVALVAVGRRARDSLPAAALLASGVYFTVHTGGDWVWTIPAVGLPAFLLMGIGASPDGERPLPARAALPAGLAAIAVALLGFAPPWLSAKFTDRSYDASGATAAAEDLRWARRLDPLAVDPLLAESALARPPADIPPLRKAVSKQPRDSELHYLLGLAYLDLGRRAQASAELEIALRLSPRDTATQAALRLARAGAQ